MADEQRIRDLPMNQLRFALPLLVVLLLCACRAPETLESQLAQVRQFQQKGDLNSSVVVLKNILQKNSKHAEARYLLGVAFKRNGQPRLAEQNFRAALDEKYDPPVVLLALAQTLFDQGAFEKVLEVTFSSDHGAAALQPEILSLRGHAQLSLNQPEDAAKSFEDALQRKPDFALALLGQVRISLNKGQLPTALTLVDRALAEDPSSIYAWLMKGDLTRATGNTDVALSAYQKALSLNPDGFAANSNLASLYMTTGKLDLAQNHIDTILRVAPDSAVGYYLLGLLKFRSKDYVAAELAAKKLSKIAPNYLPGAVLSGVIAFSLGSDKQAEQWLGEAFLKSPNSLQLRKLYAAALLKVNKVQDAIIILEPALKAAPNDSSLLTLYAEAKFRSNDIPAARKYFELAITQNPNDPRVRTGLGLTRIAAGDTERAISDIAAAADLGGGAADTLLITTLLSVNQYDKALEAVARLESKRPKDPLTFNLKGAALFAKGDTAGARKAFERASELQPAQFAAAMNLAKLDTRDNNPAEARKRFEKILESDKDNVSAMMGLADLAMSANDSKGAISWAERAMQAQPKSFAPLMILSKLYFENADYDKAIAAAREALRVQPDNAEALNILGYCQLRIGKNLESLNTYTVLVNRHPKLAAAHYGLSNAQTANGKVTAAQMSLQKAIELRPEFPEAIYALAALQLRLGKVAEVNKLLGDAQKRLPKSAMGFVIAGDAAMAEKRFAEATSAYESAFAMENTQAVLIKLYSALRRSGKEAVADALAMEWLQKNPEDTPVRYLVANTAISNKDFQRAAEQFQYARKKEPNNLALLHNLALVYERLNDRRALEVTETAYRIAPNNPGVLHNFGRLQIEMGDPARAIDPLEKVRLQVPSSQLVRFHLAKAYMKTGANARARAELEQLLRSQEDFAERADAVELLKQLRK